MNCRHSWKLCFSLLKILVELENSQNNLPHSFRKGSFPKTKSTCQKEVNNKIVQPVLTYFASAFQTPIYLTIYSYIEKYLWNPLVNFQLNPTVTFGVMLNSVETFTPKSKFNLIWVVSQG
jgi:hypothetical protein